MQLSKKQKLFCHVFVNFLKCALNFEHLKKKMSVVTLILRKLFTLKDVVT